MNEVKKLTLLDRIYNAVRAFQGKPVGSITYGLELKECSECGNKMKIVLYECDLEACGDECPNGFCHLTRDVSHAVNFEPVECVNGVVYYQEKREHKEE